MLLASKIVPDQTAPSKQIVSDPIAPNKQNSPWSDWSSQIWDILFVFLDNLQVCIVNWDGLAQVIFNGRFQFKDLVLLGFNIYLLYIWQGPLAPVKTKSAIQKIRPIQKYEYPLIFDEDR